MSHATLDVQATQVGDTDSSNKAVDPIQHIAVLIPARNEETLLPRCLRSVQRARLRLPSSVTSDLIVVADCCHDATQHLAETLIGAAGVVAATKAGSVGQARALAAQLALRRSTTAPQHCWLANTDADCEVPEDWLLTQWQLAGRGHAAVAGIVDVEDFSDHDPVVAERFRRTYLIDADGTHPHVHGANLGIRADVYARAGGWSNLFTAEDHDLWRRLRHIGASRFSTAALRVITSGRRVGRAPSGFAEALAAHNESLA